jgi:hypothetical protein
MKIEPTDFTDYTYYFSMEYIFVEFVKSVGKTSRPIDYTNLK